MMVTYVLNGIFHISGPWGAATWKKDNYSSFQEQKTELIDLISSFAFRSPISVSY